MGWRIMHMEPRHKTITNFVLGLLRLSWGSSEKKLQHSDTCKYTFIHKPQLADVSAFRFYWDFIHQVHTSRDFLWAEHKDVRSRHKQVPVSDAIQTVSDWCPIPCSIFKTSFSTRVNLLPSGNKLNTLAFCWHKPLSGRQHTNRYQLISRQENWNCHYNCRRN